MDPMSHDYAECACHGRKCVRQLHTEDDTEGKEQMQLTRSRMASPLSDEILREPAKAAVNTLLNLRTDLPSLNTLCWNSLSQDARLLLKTCQDVHRRPQNPPRSAELKDYAHSLDTMLVDGYLGYIVESLSYDTRLKLTLMVWHFNDEELCKFLQSPIDQTEWETLYALYQAHSRQQILYDDFRRSFDFLLLSQLPPSQQLRNHPANQPEAEDRPYPQQGQDVTPVYSSSSYPHHLQPIRAYTGNYNNCGRLYPVHHRQTLGALAGGQDKHRPKSLSQSQSSNLLPESHTSIRSNKDAAVTQSDASTGTLQHHPLPIHVTSYQKSGKRRNPAQPDPSDSTLGSYTFKKPRKEKS